MPNDLTAQNTTSLPIIKASPSPCKNDLIVDAHKAHFTLKKKYFVTKKPVTWPIGPCPNISVDSGVARHGKGEETMEEDSKPETLLHPYELRFSDLLLLSCDEPLSSSSDHDEIQRLESITSCIMENLGPNGPGLLAITGVPGASSLRSSLLHFAPQLALLDFRHLNRLLKVNFYITTTEI